MKPWGLNCAYAFPLPKNGRCENALQSLEHFLGYAAALDHEDLPEYITDEIRELVANLPPASVRLVVRDSCDCRYLTNLGDPEYLSTGPEWQVLFRDFEEGEFVPFADLTESDCWFIIFKQPMTIENRIEEPQQKQIFLF